MKKRYISGVAQNRIRMLRIRRRSIEKRVKSLASRMLKEAYGILRWSLLYIVMASWSCDRFGVVFVCVLVHGVVMSAWCVVCRGGVCLCVLVGGVFLWIVLMWSVGDQWRVWRGERNSSSQSSVISYSYTKAKPSTGCYRCSIFELCNCLHHFDAQIKC